MWSLDARVIVLIIRSMMLFSCLAMLAGCQISAPIHVWQKPALAGQLRPKIMVAPLDGPPESAQAIRRQLLEHVANDAAATVRLVPSETVGLSASDQDSPHPEIALVSFLRTDGNDASLISAARQENFDYILRGQVLPDPRPLAWQRENPRLGVAWQVIPVSAKPETATNSPLATGQQHLPQHTENRSAIDLPVSVARPIIIDWKWAEQQFSDLAQWDDQEAALQEALIRQSKSIFGPSLEQHQIKLEITYGLPGSRAVRNGVALAMKGRWSEAEATWEELLVRVPFNSAAIHNLAIAKVARQDYQAARELAAYAQRLKPTKLHSKTLAWVESAQRTYHQAFQLPDPPDGWALTR